MEIEFLYKVEGQGRVLRLDFGIDVGFCGGFHDDGQGWLSRRVLDRVSGCGSGFGVKVVIRF